MATNQSSTHQESDSQGIDTGCVTTGVPDMTITYAENPQEPQEIYNNATDPNVLSTPIREEKPKDRSRRAQSREPHSWDDEDRSPVSARTRSASRRRRSSPPPSSSTNYFPSSPPFGYVASPSLESVDSPEPDDVFSSPQTASTDRSSYLGDDADSIEDNQKCVEESPSIKRAGRLADGIANVRNKEAYPPSSAECQPDEVDASADNLRYKGGRGVDRERKSSDCSYSGTSPEAQYSEPKTPPRTTEKATASKHPTMRILGPATKLSHEKAVNGLFRSMRDSAEKDEHKPGFVYCFSEKSTPGYIKIGYTVIKGSMTPYLGKQALYMDGVEDPNVKRRFGEQAKRCLFDIKPEFALFMPCAAGRMEKLIHRTLHEQKRAIGCRNKKCHTEHREWFEISAGDARATARQWQRFSALQPYRNYGRVEELWCTYVEDDRSHFDGLSTKQWVIERLPKLLQTREKEKKKEEVTTKHEEAREKQRAELEGRQDQLEEEEQNLEAEMEKLQAELTKTQNTLADIRIQKKLVKEKRRELKAQC